jgi:hypothetical protein
MAASKLPYRLRTPEELAAAKSLMSAGFVKLKLPLARSNKSAYGQQDDALVSAITLAGKKALAA